MKKILATLLALVLVLGMIPVAGILAFAEDDELSLMFPGKPNSKANPYVIGSVEDWLTFCMTPSVLTDGAYFMLTADLDFADHNTKDYLVPGDINTDCIYTDIFKGYFDGNGHVIKNLNIFQKNAAATGLFKQFDGGGLRNLTLDNVDITVEYTAEHANYLSLLIGLYRANPGDGTGALAEGWENELVENIVITDTCSITDLTAVSAPRIGFVVGGMNHNAGRASRAMTFRNIYVGATVTTQANCRSNVYVGAIFGTCVPYIANSQNVSVKMRLENIATNVTINQTLYKTNNMFSIGGLIGEHAPNALEIRNCYVNTTVNMNYGEPELKYTNKDGEEKTLTFDKTADVVKSGGVGGIVGTLGRPDNFNTQFAVSDYVIEDCAVNLTLGGTLYADTSNNIIPYTGAIVGLLGRKENTGYLTSNVKVEDVTYSINSTKYQKYGNSSLEVAYPSQNDPAIDLGANHPTLPYNTVKETAGTVKLAQAQAVKDLLTVGAVQVAPMVAVRDVAAIKLDTATNIKFWAENATAAAEFFKTKYNLTVAETGVAILKKADFDAANGDVSAVDASKVKFAKVGETVTDTIAAADYATEYVAVGYAKVTYNGTTYTTYVKGATGAKSVAGIAALAIAETAVTYTDAQKAALTALAPAN